MKQLAQQLTVTQAAKILKISAMTLRRWEAQGILIPNRTKGGARIYHLGDILSLKKGHTKVTVHKVVNKLQTNTRLKVAKSKFKPSLSSEYRRFYQILDAHTFPALNFSTIQKMGLVTILIPVLLTAVILGITLPKTPKLVENNQKPLLADSITKSKAPDSNVLGVTTSKKGAFTVNIPAIFNSDVTIGGATLDQDISSSGSPTFNTLDLSAGKNQLVLNSGGVNGTLTWTPQQDQPKLLPCRIAQLP